MKRFRFINFALHQSSQNACKITYRQYIFRKFSLQLKVLIFQLFLPFCKKVFKKLKFKNILLPRPRKHLMPQRKPAVSVGQLLLYFM